MVVAEHGGERLRFDSSLVALLPVPNVTGESLAALLADRCLSALGTGGIVRGVGAARVESPAGLANPARRWTVSSCRLPPAPGRR